MREKNRTQILSPSSVGFAKHFDKTFDRKIVFFSSLISLWKFYLHLNCLLLKFTTFCMQDLIIFSLWLPFQSAVSAKPANLQKFFQYHLTHYHSLHHFAPYILLPFTFPFKLNTLTSNISTFSYHHFSSIRYRYNKLVKTCVIDQEVKYFNLILHHSICC